MWVNREDYQRLCSKVYDLEDKVDMLEMNLREKIYDKLTMAEATIENVARNEIHDIKDQLPELVHKEIDEYKAEDKLLLKVVKNVLGEKE